MQTEQLHALTGYLGKGYLSVTLNLTVPQWQAPVWEVCSDFGVSSTTVMCAKSRGAALQKEGLRLDAIVNGVKWLDLMSAGHTNTKKIMKTECLGFIWIYD